MRLSQAISIFVTSILMAAVCFLPVAYRTSVFLQRDLITIAGFLFFAIQMLNAWRRRLLVEPNWFSAWFLAFLLLTLAQYSFSHFGISAAYLPGTVYPYATRVEWTRLVGLWLVLNAFLSAVNDRKHIKQILAAFLISVYAVCMLALVRQLLNADFHVKAAEWFGKPAFLPALSPNRNNVAVLLEMSIPLALGIFCYRFFHWHNEKGRSLSYAILQDGWLGASGFLSILAFVATLATLSKFSVVALSVGLFSFFAFALPKEHRARAAVIAGALLCLGGMLAAWLAGEALHKRFMSASIEHYVTFDMRTPFWRQAWPIFERFPIFGAGIGTFASAFSGFHRVEANYFSAHLLNDYLQLLVETGIVGLLLWIAAMAGFLVGAVRRLSSEASYFRRFIGFGLVSGILSGLSHAWLTSNFYDSANSFFLFLFIGLVQVVSREGREAPTDSSSRSKRQPWLYAAVLVMVAVSFQLFLRDHWATRALAKDASDKALLRAQALDPENAELAYRQAVFALDESRSVAGSAAKSKWIEKAFHSMREALKLNPYNTAYRTLAADLAFQLGRFEDGRDLFASAVAEMNDDAELMLAYAFYEFRRADASSDPQDRSRLIEEGMVWYQRARALSSNLIRDVAHRKLSAFPADFQVLLQDRL